jgi:spore coat protein CotF
MQDNCVLMVIEELRNIKKELAEINQHLAQLAAAQGQTIKTAELIPKTDNLMTEILRAAGITDELLAKRIRGGLNAGVTSKATAHAKR